MTSFSLLVCLVELINLKLDVGLVVNFFVVSCRYSLEVRTYAAFCIEFLNVFFLTI